MAGVADGEELDERRTRRFDDDADDDDALGDDDVDDSEPRILADSVLPLDRVTVVLVAVEVDGVSPSPGYEPGEG